MLRGWGANLEHRPCERVYGLNGIGRASDYRGYLYGPSILTLLVNLTDSLGGVCLNTLTIVYIH